MTSAPLRVGYVPEHFSTPLYFAKKHFGLDAETVPYRSGTGHMIAALRSGDIDVGIGLTEAWIAGLGNPNVEGDGGYRIVGTYVETPLCWAVSTGYDRADITSVTSLHGKKIGVSRMGSGSFVMGTVLADKQGWLNGSNSEPFSDTVVLNTFENLRNAVNSGSADFFMWEHFTSKKYYDSNEIRKIGEIYTPWSSWKIVASTPLVANGVIDSRLEDFFSKLDAGISYFITNPEEAVHYISTSLDYSEEDARAWLKTVRFPTATRGVNLKTVDGCIEVLRKAGVLVNNKGFDASAMLA